MKPALEALKARFKELEDKKNENHGNRGNFGDMYPFWNIKEGEDEKAIVRMVPYKDMPDTAVSPFIDKMEHVLSINGEDRKIPCRRMYDEECPICVLSQKYYRSEGKTSEKGKYYWRDKKSIGQAYVVKDPLPADEATGENDQGKLKIVQFGNQLSQKYEKSLKALLNEGEIDELPWALKGGLNFRIVKDLQGGHAKYDMSSSFSTKATDLPDHIIENFEPVDLTKYLPVDPGLEKVQRMLDAHLSGEDYEDDGENTTESKPSVSDEKETTTPVKEKQTKKTTKAVDKDVEETHETSSKVSAEEEVDQEELDFVEKLRRRARASS